MPTAPTIPTDLDLFKIIPANKDVRVEDLTMDDGVTKMVGPDGLLIPPARNFAQIVNSATRVYSYRFDEAMRDNFNAARAMRRDAFLLGLFEERILPTLNREFDIEVDDDRDPEQQFVRDGLSRLVNSTPKFKQMKRALMDAVWFGRAGVAWAFKRKEEVDNLWGIGKWDSVHGDSVQFSFDGYPCIMMDAQTAAWYSSHGAKYGPPGVGDLVPTDRGGTALQLHRPTWRERYAIHQHILQKADYFEGEMAGSVQGLGLRGMVYWQYVVRTDALTWMLAYMQAVGQMDLLVFNYPTGNYAAQQQQEMNAQKIIGKAAIACPRAAQGNWPAVEQIPMNSAGLTALQGLVADYFDRHIERLFVGQSMSSGADKGTGLGGTGRAEFAKSTKDEILIYDCACLDETITTDILGPLKKYNFPWAKFPVRFKSILPDLEAQEKVMSGKVLISVGVPIKADELRKAAGYSRPEAGDDVVGAPQPAPGGPPSPGGPPPGAGGGQPPAWMGAPSPAPMMAERGQNPIRYIGGMAYPGGANTHVPKFDKTEPISTTRYAGISTLELEPLKRQIDRLTKQDLDGIKISVNDVEGRIHIDVMDWGSEKVAKPLIEAAKKIVGARNVEVVNEGSKPFGTGWKTIYNGRQPLRYNLEEQKAFEAAIEQNPIEALTHEVYADWLDENGQPDEADFRRTLASVLRRRYSDGVGSSNPWWLHANYLPEGNRLDTRTREGEDLTLPYLFGGGFQWESWPDMFAGIRRAWETSSARRNRNLPTQNSRSQAPTVYKDGPHKFCSTQVDLLGEAMIRVLQAGSGILQTDLAEDGQELQPHVTIRYGLHDANPQEVAKLVGKFGPIKLRICRASIFPATKERNFDVLKFEVDSPDLTRLNRILKTLPGTDSFPTYVPHCTVAYLRAGTGEMYAARTKPINIDLTLEGLYFSDRDGKRTWISTTGKPAQPTWANNEDNPDDVPRSGAPKQYGRPQTYNGPFADEEVPPQSEPFIVPHDPLLPHNPLGPPGDQWRPGPTNPQAGQVQPGAPQDSQGRSIGPSTSPDMPPEPIDKQQLGASQPLDLDYRSPEAFGESLAIALGVHGIDDADTMQRAEAGLGLAKSLPRLVYERLAEGRLRSVVAHPNPASVGIAWQELTGEHPDDPQFGMPEGFYSPDSGVVAVNGEDPTGVFAHEMGHALDWSQPAGPGGYYQLSTSSEWQKAHRVELASGALSDYCQIDPQESFAEVARLIYGTPNGRAIAAEQFPLCFAFFASYGLV